MDLRIHGPDATPAERTAVDAVLGDAECGRRDLLLPALHAVQARFGWLPQGALNYICKRLHIPPAEAYGVATFYHLFSLKQQPPIMVHVCDDIACRIRGAEHICKELEGRLPSSVGLKRSPCLGQCERAPAALVFKTGESPTAAVLPWTTCASIVANVTSKVRTKPDTLESLGRSVPQSGSASLRLLRRIGHVDPESLQAYTASGGLNALRRAIELGPQGIIREVVGSRLVGRGGAAFPTGRKWEAVANAAVKPHYLVCNADESEPGTFKDRLLMEGDPFAVLEGMTIAAHATGCERGYIYIRGEYPLAAQRMATAIAANREAGLLGDNILGAGFHFNVEIRRGAGAYICGEETALFNSIEGNRGEPRNKPPFPVDAGLFGKPTVINNVETFVNVPHIILEGGTSFAGLGTGESSGTKLFCISGHVVRPGLYEVSFGPTLGQMIDLAGSIPEGKRIRAVLLGGAAGSFVGPDKLDMPLTLKACRAAGVSLGSGVIMVFDETVDLMDVLLRIAAFFRHESCGQCVPCRVGTVRQEELLKRLREERPIGSPRLELALLQEIGQVMRDASICGLGQTASLAIESAMPLWESTAGSERTS
jgi:NADH-quinone oxidoreductase subunit F